MPVSPDAMSQVLPLSISVFLWGLTCDDKFASAVRSAKRSLNTVSGFAIIPLAGSLITSRKMCKISQAA
eukprot:CAMPEP_0119340448 /NCGR_PEP_ID=MMETSP1333-20130426/100401_1 /TAXON_ID=418940 /ORGANISM="Scyphosphaera apsteinii, Strain RCC1455" /LENGTH=68 /DNA_ID=CAMNT_0007352203 /DNA_START=142 /DNA_END=345 /DNA_ORIENTATION=-